MEFGKKQTKKTGGTQTVKQQKKHSKKKCAGKGFNKNTAIVDNTLRIARLKLLYIAVKVIKDSNVDKVKYSIHYARTPVMLNFLNFLDTARQKPRPWEQSSGWPYRFAVQ